MRTRSTPSSSFERHLALIGRLNYAWTNTESVLVHLIAGLAGTDKETATVVFLTLNTSRARITLVERLAKMERTDPALRDAALAATRRMNGVSKLRNRYNHCIYAFDDEGGGRAHDPDARAGQRQAHPHGRGVEPGRGRARRRAEPRWREIDAINRDLWSLIVKHDLPQ